MDPSISELLSRILPFVAMSLTLLIPIVAIIGYFMVKSRKEKLWHETARLAIEKGLPPPSYPPGAEPKDPPPVGTPPDRWWSERRARKRENDLKGGLIMLGLGAALYLTHMRATFPGLVLMGIGAALVLNHLLTQGDHDHRGPPPA